jgi:hypothetical protein
LMNCIAVEKLCDGFHYLPVLISVDLDQFFEKEVASELSEYASGLSTSLSPPWQSNRLLHGKVNRTK